MKELIDQAVEKLGNKTRVAEYLSVKPQQLSEYYRGASCPAWVAGMLAELVGEDVEKAEHFAQMRAARSDAERSWWKKRLGGVAGFFIVAVLVNGLFFAHSDQARPGTTYHTERSIHYAYI